MPRLNARSDARDGDATSSDIRTRHPALEPRVSASACTYLRGNAMRWGSAIRKGQNLLVRRIVCMKDSYCITKGTSDDAELLETHIPLDQRVRKRSSRICNIRCVHFEAREKSLTKKAPSARPLVWVGRRGLVGSSVQVVGVGGFSGGGFRDRFDRLLNVWRPRRD